MQHNPGNIALLPRPTSFAPDGVTVCLTSAVLAPAPTAPVAAETPVFVDDSGARKRLVRIAGILIGLLALGFLGLVGVALATPTVATSVGLGNATPFVVPGAAAAPPAKAPTAPAPVTKPKPKAKPRTIQSAAPAPVAPAPASSHDEPVTDQTHHDTKPHHGNHTNPTGDHSKGDHTDGQTNPPAETGQTGQTDGQTQPGNPTDETGDQIQTGANPQAPAQAEAPVTDNG